MKSLILSLVLALSLSLSGQLGQAIEVIDNPVELEVFEVNKPIADLDIDFSNYSNNDFKVSEIKKEIDKQNKYIRELHNNIIVTENGIKVFTSEDISGLDKASNNIAQLQEILRRRVEKDLIDFREISYPLISEIEQFGIRSDYSENLYTDDFFDEKEIKDYKDRSVEYDYFKELDLEMFIRFVDALDFLNLENTQVVFSPYRILSSYAYCENFAPECLNIRRTRVFYNPNDGEDIVSTLYHELGHLIYFELVEGNEENYNKYYNIYKQEFDVNNASDNYGRWDSKLSENFAEDFKIFVTKRVMQENEELVGFIKEREESFLGKTTIYEVKEETDNYFEYLLKEHIINTNKLRPDITLKVKDYEEGFSLYDASYLNQHSNKIVTNSNIARIEFKGEKYEVSPIKYIVRAIDEETYGVKSEREYKIKEDVNEIEVKISDNKIYEIELVLSDKDGKYMESVIYYLIKM